MTRKVNPIVSVFETLVSCNLIELAYDSAEFRHRSAQNVGNHVISCQSFNGLQASLQRAVSCTHNSRPSTHIRATQKGVLLIRFDLLIP